MIHLSRNLFLENLVLMISWIKLIALLISLSNPQGILTVLNKGNAFNFIEALNKGINHKVTLMFSFFSQVTSYFII